MESSGDQGLIVFTLGTYCSAIDIGILRVFADAFSEIDHKVIWQIDNSLKRKLNFKMPTNVKTMPWIPQNDLLGMTQFQTGIGILGREPREDSANHT